MQQAESPHLTMKSRTKQLTLNPGIGHNTGTALLVSKLLYAPSRIATMRLPLQWMSKQYLASSQGLQTQPEYKQLVICSKQPKRPTNNVPFHMLAK